MTLAQRTSLLASFLVLALLLVALVGYQSVGAQPWTDEAAPLPGGEEVFAQACATCHGTEGDGRLAPALDGNLNLARSDYVTAIILRGRDGMPPFHGRLSGAEIAAVSRYVRSAWGNDFVTEAEDEVEEDETAGETEAGARDLLVAEWWRGAEDASDLYERICARCHGEDGGGGFGPPLVRNDNLSDAQYVVGKILHGQGGMPAFEGLLTPEQIAELATYIRDAFGTGTGSIGLDAVLALQSSRPRDRAGALRVSVFPSDARLSVVGPDRFVHFVSAAGSGGTSELAGLLPGVYTVTGTREGYRTGLAEVEVLPLHRSRVTLNLQSSSQTPPDVESGEERTDGARRVQRGTVTALLPPPTSAGGIDYRRSCALCHGPEGGGGIGPPLAGNGRLQSPQFVLDRILNGTSVMPSFADRLLPEQIAAIATFERTSWGNDHGAISPDQVASQQPQEDSPTVTPPLSAEPGAAIYEEYCSACHGGLGFGAVGPPLQGNPALADLPYTLSRIVMGGGGMTSFHGVLSTAEMTEVASFIRDAWGNEFGPVGLVRTQNYHGGSSSLQE